MQKYADLFARSRRAVLVFVLLVTGLGVFGLARVEFDDVPRNIFASDDEGYARLLQLFDEFGSDDNDVLFVLDRDDWFTPEAVAFLDDLAERARAIPKVQAVLHFGDVPIFDGGMIPRPLLVPGQSDLEHARNLARAHPLIDGQLLSGDGRTALVIVRLDDSLIRINGLAPPVAALRKLGQELKAAGRDAGIQVGVTGLPPIRVEIYETIQWDQIRFTLIGGVFCILLSLVLFRSASAVACTTIPPLIGATWAFGFIGLTGERLDILSGVLSMLVIVIGLTDAVHLMIDIRLSRGAGATPREAAIAAIRHLGMPCALTSLTTAIGFGSLMLADVPAIRHFGALAAGSVVMGFLAVITVTPLMSSVLPNVGVSVERKAGGRAGLWMRCAVPLVRFVMAHALLVSAGGIVLSFTCLYLSLQLSPENRLTEALPREEAYEALQTAEEAFGGVLPSYVLVEWDEPTEPGSVPWVSLMDAVGDLIASTPGLGKPLSVVDFLDVVPGGRAAPESVLAMLPADVSKRLIRPDLRRALVLTRVPDRGSDVMNPLFDGLSSDLRSLEGTHPGFRLALTGTDVVARKNVNRMIDDLTRSLAFAALVIFGVIAIEFRSLRLGLISLLPNLFPLVLVGGVLRLVGQPLLMATAVLFTVLLGLAVDDTIHFLSRLRREERLAGPNADRSTVIESAYLAVGRAILITTLILVVGFLSISLSSVPTNKIFAYTACLGLVGALVGDLILLPALTALSGPRSPRSDEPAELR